MRVHFGLLPCTLLATLCSGQNTSTPAATTFTNPILDATGADPWVIRHGEYYYMTYTTNEDITLLRSRELTNWNTAESKKIFSPPPGQPYSTDLWAPELHYLQGAWYIIFTADPNHDTPPPEVDMYCPFNCPAIYHRMYVLEGSSTSQSHNTSSDTQDTQSAELKRNSGDDTSGDDTTIPSPWTTPFTYKSQLSTYNQFAIDGTYLTHASSLYHIYSCWYTAYSSWPSNLCITKMTNPYTVSSSFSERQIISTPTNPWEKTPYGRPDNDRLSSNEAPQTLRNPTTGQIFLIYSAARSDNRNYCLGQVELVSPTGDIADADPMNPGDWRKKNDGCVFYQNAEEMAYGVGHASFTTSPDGKEDWIVYHGMRDPSNGWAARTIRAQRFGWNEDGSPQFPRPGYGPFEVPSGQGS